MSSLSVPSLQRNANDYDHVGTGGAGETWYIAGAISCAALSAGTAFGVNLLYVVPFVAPTRGGGGAGVIDRLGYEITVSVAGGARIGIYDTAPGQVLYPNALVVDSGVIANSAAFKTATVSVPLNPGKLYWLAHAQGVAGISERGINVNGMQPTLGISNAGGVTALRYSITVAHTSTANNADALPATYAAGGVYLTNVGPALFMRFSA